MPYLSKEEIQFAINRLPPLIKESTRINPKSLAKRVLKTPTMFALPPLFHKTKKPLIPLSYILTTFSILSAMIEAFAFQVGDLQTSPQLSLPGTNLFRAASCST